MCEICFLDLNNANVFMYNFYMILFSYLDHMKTLLTLTENLTHAICKNIWKIHKKNYDKMFKFLVCTYFWTRVVRCQLVEKNYRQEKNPNICGYYVS
jgi:hypothetical protein